MNRLEIGPGTANGKSVIWADADTADTAAAGATCNSRWGQEPFPFADSTYGLVFASHVLEHVPWYRTDAAIAEVHRVLKVGGEFEVYVPDFKYIVDCYTQKKCGDRWRVFNPDNDWMTWVNGRLFTYGEDAVELERPIVQTQHKACFDADYLHAKLSSIFSKVTMVSNRRNGLKHSVPEVGAIAVK